MAVVEIHDMEIKDNITTFTRQRTFDAISRQNGYVFQCLWRKQCGKGDKKVALLAGNSHKYRLWFSNGL